MATRGWTERQRRADILSALGTSFPTLWLSWTLWIQGDEIKNDLNVLRLHAVQTLTCSKSFMMQQTFGLIISCYQIAKSSSIHSLCLVMYDLSITSHFLLPTFWVTVLLRILIGPTDRGNMVSVGCHCILLSNGAHDYWLDGRLVGYYSEQKSKQCSNMHKLLYNHTSLTPSSGALPQLIIACGTLWELQGSEINKCFFYTVDSNIQNNIIISMSSHLCLNILWKSALGGRFSHPMVHAIIKGSTSRGWRWWVEVWNGELCRGTWGTQSQTYPLLTIRYYTLLYCITVLASVCIQTILQLPFHASFPEQKGATFELDLWNRQKDGEKLTGGDGGVIQTDHTNEPYGFIQSKTTSDWHGEKLGWTNNKNSFNLHLRSKVLQTFFKLITFHHLQHPWYAIWDWLPFQWTTMSFCGFRKIKSWLRRTTFSAVLMWRWHLQWWSFGCESRSRVKKGLMLLGMDVWLSLFLVGKAFLVCLVCNSYWPSIVFLVQTVFCWNLFRINWNPWASGIRTRVRTGKNDRKTTFHTYTHTHTDFSKHPFS